MEHQGASPRARRVCWARAETEYGECRAQAIQAGRAGELGEELNAVVEKLNELVGGTSGAGGTVGTGGTVIGTGGTVIDRASPFRPSSGFGAN